jgi:DNA-binding NarL/FixJ family response regulator
VTARQSLIELTGRQLEVLARLAWGWDHPQIAKDLKTTVTATRVLGREAYVALGADTAAHAVALAIGLGLLPLDVATNPQPSPGGHRVPQ